MFRNIIPATVVAAGGCGLVFALWPSLDIAISALFYAGDGHFVGRTSFADLARKIGYSLPFMVLFVMTLAWLVRRFSRQSPAPSDRGLLMLWLTLAIGPGLLVNVLFKDHSHRPRPVQIREFGGTMEFRPWYRFDGSCQVNCSFVSGEASEAFWMLAPASLAPPPLLPYSVAAALIFGLAVSGLRLAYGGHFFSDVIFAAVLMILIIAAARQVFCPRSASVVSPRS